MDLRELNKRKLQLTESLLKRVEQLKKTMDEIVDLQKILSKKESEVTSLQSLAIQDKKTHTLKVRIRELELSSERNEREIERLREEVPRKDDLYRKLFEENQELRFEVNMHRVLHRHN